VCGMGVGRGFGGGKSSPQIFPTSSLSSKRTVKSLLLSLLLPQVSLTHSLHLPRMFRASSMIPDASCWSYKEMHIKPKLFW
jgi:hypothetical protein